MDGNETLVLEHYRVAVFELTRQNILLRRQLAAAEARLASEDPAVDMKTVVPPPRWPTGEAPRPDAAVDAARAASGKGAPQLRKVARARFWSKAEHARFLEGVKRFGSQDAHSIAAHVGTRTVTQVRTHAQKYFLKLAKQQQQKQQKQQQPDGAVPANPAADGAEEEEEESAECGDACEGSEDDGAAAA